MYEAHYTFTQAQARQVARQWFWKMLGRGMVVVGILLCLSIAGLILWKTERVFFAFFVGASFCMFARHAQVFDTLRRAELVDLGEVMVRMTDETLDQSTALGDSQNRWSAFRKAVLTTDFLFLVTRVRSQAVAIPRAALSAEAIAFAEERVSSARSTGADA